MTNFEQHYQFKEILKKEIDKINDKVEGKIHQRSQDKSLLQGEVSELKNQNIVIAAFCEETEQHS